MNVKPAGREEAEDEAAPRAAFGAQGGQKRVARDERRRGGAGPEATQPTIEAVVRLRPRAIAVPQCKPAPNPNPNPNPTCGGACQPLTLTLTLTLHAAVHASP